MAVSRINEAGLNVNQYGNRNLIINGAMRVAQRSTSEAALGADSTSYRTMDRFKSICAGSSAGRYTMSQSTDAPVGFANSLKIDVTTADTSIAAGERFDIFQLLEGQDVQQFAKGTSSAKEYTVSFYVKANAAFTFCCELFDNTNNRQISKLFTTTTDWVRQVITFPADTTGAFADSNASALQVGFWLHAGSTYTGGTLNNSSWASFTNANRAAGIDSIYSSTSNEIYITGVQLEVGDTATDFEHRTFGDELLRCYRYYQLVENTVGSLQYIGITQGYTTSNVYGMIKEYIIPMRAVPTVGQSGDFKFAVADSSGVATGAIANLSGNSSGWYSSGWGGGGGNVIQGGASVIYWANGSKLTADAEL